MDNSGLGHVGDGDTYLGSPAWDEVVVVAVCLP